MGSAWRKASRADTMKRACKRVDGWGNIYTGLGIAGKDKAMGKFFGKRAQLKEETLASLYADEGMGKKIVELPTRTMVKNWVTIEGDTSGTYQAVYEQIKFKKHLTEHLIWDGVHGGSLMVVGVDDGTNDFMAPLNEAALKTVEFFQVYDRWRVFVDSEDLNKDPNSEQFGKPEFYTIRPFNGQEFKVHYTRAHQLTGELVPSKYKSSVGHIWGNSLYQAVYDYLSRFGTTYANVDSIVDDFVQVIIQIENLQQMIAAGKDDLVKKRIQLINLGKSMIKSIILDGNEKYTKEASNIGGLAEIVQEVYIALAAITNIPVTLLMGRSPAGENATGEADFDAWYDYIETRQESKMTDCFQWINNIISKCSGYTLFSKTPVVKFNPLKRETLKQILEGKKSQADIDKIYWEMNALSSEEIRESRFGGDTYSFDTKLLSRKIPVPIPEEEEEEEEEE